MFDGILSEVEPPSPTILLIPEDYPELYRNPQKLFAHPEDYQKDRAPIKPQLFLYRVETRSRLFLRISIRLSRDNAETDQLWTAATFLLDTGACPHMFVSPALKNLLKERIHDEDASPSYVKVDVLGDLVRCIVKTDLPDSHQPANVMGLPMFFLMGLKLNQGKMTNLVCDADGVAKDIGEQILLSL